MVTSDHVTKMAVTPFNPAWSRIPCYMQTNFMALCFIKRELLHVI